VAVSPLAAQTPHIQGVQPSRPRDVAQSLNDIIILNDEPPVINCVQPSCPQDVAQSLNDIIILNDESPVINSCASSPLSLLSSHNEDPFVSLTMEEKNNVLHSLLIDRRVAFTVLKKMASCHQNMLVGRKNAETLRAEFIAHRCTNACLILKSEAMSAGLLPRNFLSPSEL
jgi:hypothetical protein